MNTRGKILIVASSIDTFELKSGQKVPVDYYLNELAISVLKATEAGYQIVLATPKGNQPVVDQQSFAARHLGDSEAKLRQAIDPPSDHAIANLFVEALDRYSASKAAA